MGVLIVKKSLSDGWGERKVVLGKEGCHVCRNKKLALNVLLSKSNKQEESRGLLGMFFLVLGKRDPTIGGK